MTSSPKLAAHERRAAIVASAITLFSEKGFRGATTRELAAAVGVSEPVLYQHFATKRDLYAAIIESKSNDMARFMSDMEKFLSADDDAGFFRHLAQTILDFHEHDPAYLRLLLFSGLERHELSDLFHERQACNAELAVAGYIERRIGQGAFRSMNALFVAQSFMGMVFQYGLKRLLNPSLIPPLSRDQVVDGMVGIFLKGIQNEAP